MLHQVSAELAFDLQIHVTCTGHASHPSEDLDKRQDSSEDLDN